MLRRVRAVAKINPNPSCRAVKPIRLLCLVLFFLFFGAIAAVAAPAKRYDLAYTWETSVQRVLDYQGRVARVSGLRKAGQLRIVGRGREYGLVHPAQRTLAQANSLATQQTRALRRAGLKAAQPVAANGYHGLYHVRYSQGTDLKRLARERAQVAAALGRQADGRLVIEKIDARSHAVVYRSWANQNAARQLAGKHRTLLRKAKLTPTVVAAAVRPAVSDVADVTAPTRSASKQPVAVAAPPASVATGKAAAASPFQVAARPAAPPQESRPELPEASVVPAVGSGLNGELQAFLRNQQNKGRLRKNDSTALVAYDLSSNSYVASLNAGRSFQAASMIKPFVALAFFHQVDRGTLKYTAKHRQMMERMIQHSDNEATNWFLRQVGGPARCQALLKQAYGPLVRRVSITEYIPPGGKTYRNSAQPTDYVEYLKALWQHRLPQSQEMLRVMALPGRDRVFCGTQLPQGTRVYNKTGTTAYLCGDMAIIVPPARGGRQVPYIIVGIVQRPSKPGDFRNWMISGGNVIRDFSSLVYREMKGRYNLL